MGEREAQALLSELADVRSLDVLSLLELDNAEDLKDTLVAAGQVDS